MALGLSPLQERKLQLLLELADEHPKQITIEILRLDRQKFAVHARIPDTTLEAWVTHLLNQVQ